MNTRILAFLALGAAFLAPQAVAQTIDQCVHVLNPTSANALSMTGTVQVNASSCGVLVNSSSPSALRFSGSGSVTAKYVRVTGGTSVTGSGTISPAPQTGVAAQPDPLTFLTPPPSVPCDYTNFTKSGSSNTVLNPGTYCNGIRITGSGNVTFNPGVYVMRGGGFSGTGSGEIQGTGVTFFLTEGSGFPYSPLSVSGTVDLNLSAPTSGRYYGILFYQDPAIGAGKPASAVSGGGQSTVSGVFYFPTTGLTYSGSSSQGSYLALIAQTLNLTGSVTLGGSFPGPRSPLMPPVTVGITPLTANLRDGQTQQFTAVVGSALNSAVTWASSPSGIGSINGSGLFTAPASLTSQQTVTITATSVEDPTKSASAIITLTPQIQVSVTPPSATLYANQTRAFTAAVLNASNPAVIWSVTGAGSINSSGVYTAPSTITAQQTATIRATSQQDATRFATAVVTLLPPIGVSVAPSSAALIAGQTQQFTASVTNSNDASVTWSLNSGALGTISASGLYTAPAPIATQQTVTVTATSQADPTRTSTATITLQPIQISLAPPTATVLGGQKQQFTATVTNANSGAVTWSLAPATGAGTISATGEYQAPAVIAAAQTVTVTARSQEDSTKFATATITLPAVTIGISPQTETVFVTRTQQFTATVNNAVNSGVNWTITPQTGSIDSTGLYTAPATLSTEATVTVTATSQANPAKTATATLTIPPVQVTVGPVVTTLSGGQTQQFTANVVNAAVTSVTWTASPAGVGSINSAGLYTAPAATSGQTVTITATSTADPNRSGSATITLLPTTVTVTPQNISLTSGQTQQFTASSTGVTWSISPQIGTVSTSGLYTAPSPISSQQTITVTATLDANQSILSSASVTLLPVTVTVSPTTKTLFGGQTQQFTATLTNTTNQAVTWSVTPASGAGTINTSGLYTPPSSISAQQNVTVKATSVADPSKSDSASVTLAPVQITMTPATVTLGATQTQQFTATVTNATNTSVIWTVNPQGLGTINSAGLFTALNCVSAQQTVTVTAASVADPSKTVSATVTMINGSGYGYQRAIRIDHTKIPSAQTNFPVLISGIYPYLADIGHGGNVQSSSGYDIVFTSDLAGVAKLDHEVESYDPVTGRLVAWVRIPSLSNTTDTILYLNYGKTGVTASQESSTGVWDSNFQAVWHLKNGPTLSAADATVNGKTGTVNGATAIAGKIGGAANFSGTGQYITIGNMGARPTRGTVSMWVNAASVVGNSDPFTTGAFGNQCSLVRFALQTDGAMVGIIGNQGDTCVVNNAKAALTSGFSPLTWHHLAITWDSSIDSMSVFYDGKLAKTAQNGYWPGTFAEVKIGVGYELARVWNGQIDETRMSAAARSADWIATEYNNQNSPSTFYTIYPENTMNVAVDPAETVLYASQTRQFSSLVFGGCSAVNWSVTPAAGTINASGQYTAPASIAAQQTVTVKATSANDPSRSGTATVTLYPAISVSLTQAGVTLYQGQSQQFNALVSNAVNTAVTWTMNPLVGTLSASGLYTAPSSITATQSVVVTATSQADPTKSGSVIVTLLPGQGVQTSEGIFGLGLDRVAQALCRRPHVAPVVDAGPDQFTNLSGSGTASVGLEGAASNYFLSPGKSLAYTWSKTSGPGTVTFSNANAGVTQATFSAAGNYELQLSINDGIATSTDSMFVTVSPAVFQNGYSFLITPVANGPSAVGTQVTLTLRLQGIFTNGGPIDLTITGANPRTVHLTADGNGVATYSYFGTNPGTDTISGIGAGWCCSPSFASNTVTVNWVADNPVLSSSPVTGRFYTNDGTGVFNIPAGQTPAFTQTFPSINFNPAAGPENPTAVTNLTRPFTSLTTDSAGAYTGLIAAQGNNLQAGVGSLYNFSAVFTGTLNVPSAGQMTFTFTHDDSFVFSIGGGASRVSGTQTGTLPVNSALQGLPVMGGFNQRSNAVLTSTVVVNFPAAGTYPYEVDYAKGGDAKLSLQMLASGLPIPAAAQLTLTPNQSTSALTGDVKTFVLTAVNTRGVVMANMPATVTITGPNQQTRSVTTDSVGQVSVSYAGSGLSVGSDQIQASALVGGTTAVSNAVKVTWNNGVNQAPQVSAGSAQSVTLPGKAILDGSVNDDGLPTNTLTITWSKVSGPGTVTFDAPNQAATAASFSLAGSYVLQLSASDGVLTTNSTVTVTGTADPNWSSGWIASPVDKGPVSGQVPITLTPGITLTSGTLTYYPSGHPEQAVTLNASTVGSGTVGSFDATLLENGGYFVVLNATNSAGVTQNNVVYVTAIGEYKPGRVTATVTDFTVPSTGLAIQIQRHYDSLQKNQVGDFGYGWKLGIRSLNFSAGATGDVTFTVNGRRRTFYFTPPPNQIFQGWYTPQYTGEPGFFGSLVNTGDNCNGVLQRVGNVWQCALANAGSTYQPTGYRYKDPYGRVYTLAADGTLQSLQDLNGNTLTIASTGITSSTGLNIPFVRDAQGRITRITDSTSAQYNYAYDAAGNLQTVTLPSIATSILYGYDASHLLTSERDPRGNSGSSTYYPDGKLKSVTDAAGQTTQYAYDLVTRTTTVTNPDGGVVVTVADSYGSPLSVKDPLNRTTTYTYDANHNVLTETNPLNQTTTFTYDANGFKTSLKDPLNNVWSATYNAVGGPLTVTNPLSQTQTLTYDANFNISTITDPLGQVAGFTYTTSGLPATMRDARGNNSSYSYDPYGNRTSYTDPLSRTTTSVYDTMGRMTSQTDPRSNATGHAYDVLGRKSSVTDAYGKVTSYTYDNNGNKLTETDPLNRTTSYAYDGVNRLTQVTYPDSTTRSYTYDFRGNKLTETDQLGRVTKSVYDLAGQLTSVTQAFGTADAGTVSYTYDGAGRKLTTTDPRNNTTNNTYDSAGRLTSVRDPIGNVTQFGYDAKGQRTTMTDAKNRVTTYIYDSRGRQLTETFPDGKTITKTYDGLSLVTSVTDEENRTTQYVFDAASQLTKVIDALNQQTQYGYDLSGNKISQTDARNNTTTYVWDKLNRRTSRTLPLAQSETVAYDFVGNMSSRTDFNGKITTYAYDSLNRLLSRTPDASFSAPAIVFTYTTTGQRASMVDPSGTTTYTYDSQDRLKTKVTPQGSLTYTYDSASNVTSAVSSNIGGYNVSYAWDGNNRLAGVTSDGGTTTYAYDATNQVSSFAYPNGVTHSYTYNNRDRMSNLTVTGPSGLIASYSQTFSFSGRKTNVTENTGRTVAYNYDSIYRLLGETVTGATPGGSVNYMLDAVGNRLSLTSTLAGISAQTNTFDDNDRLNSNVYDANGNTKTSDGVHYTYDFEDRLLFASSGIQFVYDGDGVRVARTEAGSTIRYLVDPLSTTQYPQVVEELTGSGVLARYAYGHMRINQNRSSSIGFYTFDEGGSVRSIVDGSGTVTDTYVYDAFGSVVSRIGSSANNFLYRGEEVDSSLRLQYLRARWYEPATGRFLTADKVEGSSNGCPSAPPSILANHLFVYGDSDPINHIDPTGYSSIGSAIRSVQLRMARVGLERIAKASVHHIGCVVAIATGLFIAQQLVESGVPFIRAPHGGGINLAAGVEGARTGAPVVDGPLRQVVGIYSASPLPRGVRTALDAMEHASQGLLKIVYSQGPHAERAVEAEITSSGREVASMWTLWRLCGADRQNCAAAFAYAGGQLARGLGHCIIPSGMAP